jgi:hypothetical protein
MAEDFDSLVELLRRNTDEFGWLQPLLDDPDSFAVLGAQIQEFARLGPAVDHNGAQATISGSSAGQAGTSSITVSRAATGTTGTIPKGYGFVDSRGVKAVLQADVPVGGGAATLVLPVVTIRQTELINSEDDPGFAVDPASPIVPSSGGVLIAPVGSPGMTSTTFQTIGPSDPIQGGAADYLSVHASERGLQRQQNEAESDFRQRIRNIPDVVSPIAVADAVQQAAQALGLPPMLVLEPFNDGATAALKLLHGLSHFDALCFDDPGGIGAGPGSYFDDPVSGLVALDRRTATAYFEIVAQDFVRDETGAEMFWDALSFLDDPVFGYPFPVPSLPAGVTAALFALINDVTAKKAGGVNFDLFLRPFDEHVAVAGSNANVFTEVWTMTPPVGTVWIVESFDVGHDTPSPVGAAAHHVVFDLDGGGTLATADFSSSWTEDVQAARSIRITAIHGFVRSDGVVTANLVGHAAVVEFTL